MFHIDSTINHCSIHLFCSFVSSSIHTYTHTSIHFHTLTHIHSHLPELRIRIDKREKLTPYVRFQSVCRSSLWEASDRMIIALRLFVSYTLSRPLHSFVRSSVHIVQRMSETYALLFCMYVYVRACTSSLANEQTCSLA